jgi:flagellar hook-associated protein 1 FlgK
MSDLLNVGASALRAAFSQMRTTGHNIANVNTPGYSRQEVQLATAEGTFSGGGFVGRGVVVETVVRRYDAHLTSEVASGLAMSSADKVRTAQLERLDRMFADTENGIGAGLDDLTSAMADVVNRPSDPSARTVAANRANMLAERFNAVHDRLEDVRGQVDLRMGEGVNKVNESLKQLAAVNEQIAKTNGSGQPSNDLLDRRDVLVEQVNKQMKATAYVNYDNTVSLFSASGQALVVGKSIANFSLSTDSLDPRKLTVSLNTSGRSIPMESDSLGGGELAGLIRFRDEDLTAVAGRLGQLAATVGTAYNAQQALGRDATGTAGAPMFSMGSPRAFGSSLNTGNAVMAAAVVDGTQVSAGDYEFNYDGTNWSATRASDKSVVPVAGFPVTIDGVQVSLSSGTAAAGDKFLVRAASEFANDFSMVLASPSRLATGLAAAPQLGATNAGDAGVSSFQVTANDPNLTAPVSIQFTSPTTFDVVGTGTGNPTGLTYTPGMTLNYNGWQMTLKGTPAASDTISVGATQNPAVDNRNARAMVGIADRLLVGGQRAVDAYGDLTADIGIRTQSAQSSMALSSRTLEDAEAARSEISGVNLDEEAARLLQYQQAYQAAAKLIATAQTVFDTLLQAAT